MVPARLVAGEIPLGHHVWVNGHYEGVSTRYDGAEGVMLKTRGNAEVRWNRYASQTGLIVSVQSVSESRTPCTKNKAELAAEAAAKLVDLKTRSGGYQWWTWIAERAEHGEEECTILMEIKDAVDDWRDDR